MYLTTLFTDSIFILSVSNVFLPNNICYFLLQLNFFRLRDYTTAESVLSESSSVPHYILFIEPEAEISNLDLDLDLLDSTLRSDHSVYESFRVKGSIDKIRVIQETLKICVN